MKTLFAIVVVCALNFQVKSENLISSRISEGLIGEWHRMTHMGAISLNFKEDGVIEGDFGKDGSIDIVAKYQISNDTLSIFDKNGKMCKSAGIYKINLQEYYLSFNLIADSCGGRIKSILGYWVKSDHQKHLNQLSNNITKNKKPDDLLSRARMYLALSKNLEAQKDLDKYLKTDSLNASAFINRAASKMPKDFEGVVTDCKKAITLEPDSKNAYFLKGLALYSLGKKEEACDDFHKAIELGFYILKFAEQQKCSEYWKDKIEENK